MLDRHKIRFHSDYLKARAIYYDNIMVFPELKYGQNQNTNEVSEAKKVTDATHSERSFGETEIKDVSSRRDAKTEASSCMADQGNASVAIQKINKEQKCE